MFVFLLLWYLRDIGENICVKCNYSRCICFLPLAFSLSLISKHVPLRPEGKSSICFGEKQTLNQYSPRPPSLTIEERCHWWVGAAKRGEFELFFFFFFCGPPPYMLNDLCIWFVEIGSYLLLRMLAAGRLIWVCGVQWSGSSRGQSFSASLTLP